MMWYLFVLKRRDISVASISEGRRLTAWDFFPSNSQKVIKETFSLKEVPKEALYLGLAGVIPYLITSLQTVYLAWEMNNAVTTGSGTFISGTSAELIMNVIEPLQIGYGAVVCSIS